MSNFKVTQLKKIIDFDPIGRFRTVMPIWIHQWLWHYAQSLSQHRRGALLFFLGHRSNFKDTRGKQPLILTQIGCFRTVTPVWIHQCLWNDTQGLKQHRRGVLLFSRSSVKFQGHTGQKITDLDPYRAFLDYNFSLNSPMALKWCTKLNVV